MDTTGATLSKTQKETLKADYPEIDSSTPNSFAYFLGAALRQSNLSIAFVLPDSVLIKDYARTRELVAPKLTDIAWYLNTGVPESCRQFVYVEHDVCVLILNQVKSIDSCRIRKQFYDPTLKENQCESYEELKKNFIFKEHDFCFNLLIRSKERAILEKLAGHVSLESITQCHEGIHTGNSRDLLFHDRAINRFCKPLFYGGRAGDQIANYHSERSNWYVDYRIIRLAGWPGSVHYEFMAGKEFLSVEFHIESTSHRWLGEVIRKFPADKNLGYPHPLEWEPKWSGSKGRVRTMFPITTAPDKVAEAMCQLIAATRDRIATALAKPPSP